MLLEASVIHDRFEAIGQSAAGRITVFLDGVDITNTCYAADLEAGIAWCYAKDEADQHVILRDESGAPVDVLRIERRGVMQAFLDGGPVPDWLDSRERKDK